MNVFPPRSHSIHFSHFRILQHLLIILCKNAALLRVRQSRKSNSAKLILWIKIDAIRSENQLFNACQFCDLFDRILVVKRPAQLHPAVLIPTHNRCACACIRSRTAALMSNDKLHPVPCPECLLKAGAIRHIAPLMTEYRTMHFLSKIHRILVNWLAYLTMISRKKFQPDKLRITLIAPELLPNRIHTTVGNYTDISIDKARITLRHLSCKLVCQLHPSLHHWMRRCNNAINSKAHKIISNLFRNCFITLLMPAVQMIRPDMCVCIDHRTAHFPVSNRMLLNRQTRIASQFPCRICAFACAGISASVISPITPLGSVCG